MDTKPWYKSKIVWMGIVATAIGILDAVYVWLETTDFSWASIIMLVIGILTVVSRIWFTNTTIKS